MSYNEYETRFGLTREQPYKFVKAKNGNVYCVYSDDMMPNIYAAYEAVHPESGQTIQHKYESTSVLDSNDRWAICYYYCVYVQHRTDLTIEQWEYVPLDCRDLNIIRKAIDVVHKRLKYCSDQPDMAKDAYNELLRLRRLEMGHTDIAHEWYKIDEWYR